MLHPLQEMMLKRQEGKIVGIPSYCSANELVIEAALERAMKKNRPVLIEATSNQVNQYGGYTGMKPQDFMSFVDCIAKRVGCKKELIILAGDHLGPLVWCNEPEESAMQKAETLVYEYVKAGFTKIHLDTSMKLGDDSPYEILETEVIARRGVRLYQVCIKAYEELKKNQPDALRPVFVIGSEVPIPGGSQEAEDTISVTKREDFAKTVDTYKRIFDSCGIKDAWSDIIAVVVQPGVEFGDSRIFMYDSEAAAELCGELKQYPELVFEGHSTDFQSPFCLKKMVEDGIAILKVGPALTFGLREALFALSMIETELVEPEKQSNLIRVIEDVMVSDPKDWESHYHGDEKEKAFARKYSFSDRSRYYMNNPNIVAAIRVLFDNLRTHTIPWNILHQYMPVQYNKVRDGKLSLDPRELAKDGAVSFMKDYEYAVMLSE